jgi:ribose transport system substrate-binding protein
MALTAACGSSDSPSSGPDSKTPSTTSGTAGADAAAAVQDAMAAPTGFPDVGPTFDASKASGKKAWYISYSEQSPALQAWSKNMSEALKAYGVDLTIFDGKGQQSEFERGMDRAIADGADVIVLLGIDPASLSAKVAEAKDRGIPVLVGSNGVVGKPDTPGVVGAVTLNHVAVGADLANWMVADAGGKSFHAVMFTHPGVLGLDPLVGSVKDNLSKLCGDCELKVESVPFTQLNTLPQLVQNDIQRDPELKYAMSVYDFELLSLVTGVQQAGAADQVKLGSFNATQGVMQAMAKGSAIAADVGNPNDWVGYALADQIMRVLAGVEPVEDEMVPLRLFTPDNLGDIDVNGSEASWYGDVDFKAGYQKLWGTPGS